MQFLMGLSVALDRFNTAIGKTAAWLLIPLVGVIMLDVVNRKLHLLTTLAEHFKASGNVAAGEFVESYLTSTKFQDLEWHLHAALFLLCLGFAYVRNAHVRIELVRERFSPEVKAWLELIGSVIFLLPYATIVLYFSYEFAMRSYDMNEVSASLTGLDRDSKVAEPEERSIARTRHRVSSAFRGSRPRGGRMRTLSPFRTLRPGSSTASGTCRSKFNPKARRSASAAVSRSKSLASAGSLVRSSSSSSLSRDRHSPSR